MKIKWIAKPSMPDGKFWQLWVNESCRGRVIYYEDRDLWEYGHFGNSRPAKTLREAAIKLMKWRRLGKWIPAGWKK